MIKSKLSSIENYDHTTDWYYEGRVSAKLVNYLKNNGYRIEKDNSAKCSNRGVDIIATDSFGVTELIEVKGYPTQYYTKRPHKGKPKDTSPKLQAGHWFSEALLACIYNYGKYAAIEKKILALAFPLNDRYTQLIDKAATFFTNYNLNIRVYLIAEDGTVQVSNLNRC